jgi:glycosyltransferase involved in cell wall biosynthesis
LEVDPREEETDVVKVLVVHNEYVSTVPSGENVVVAREIVALRERQVGVSTYIRRSDEIARMPLPTRLSLLASPTYARPAVTALRQMFDIDRPDVLHLHNPFPLISPWVIKEATRVGVPVVQTVHNYRHGCLNGILYRDDHPCSDCLDRNSTIPGVIHACYRGSRVQSAAMAVAHRAHRRTWSDVETFVPVSRHMAGFLKQLGVPENRLEVKPNLVPDPGVSAFPGAGFLYAGRLEPSKGVTVLVAAWLRLRQPRPSLTIAGDGSLAGEMRHLSRSEPGLSFVGRVTAGEVESLRQQTAVAVIPSLVAETHSSAPESFAAARPVIASAVGALPELVDSSVGWVVPPGDELRLSHALLEAGESGDAVGVKGAAARIRWQTTFAPAANVDQLLSIYSEAISRRQLRVRTTQERPRVD